MKRVDKGWITTVKDLESLRFDPSSDEIFVKSSAVFFFFENSTEES